MSLTDKSRIEINPLRDFRYVAIATRYACGSICFCITRHRRDMSKARGIYLISNWSEATIYRVRAAGVPRSKECALGVRSGARTYRVNGVDISTKEKTRARIEGFSPFTLALSACNKGLGLAHFAFVQSNAMLALSDIFQILR